MSAHICKQAYIYVLTLSGTFVDKLLKLSEYVEKKLSYPLEIDMGIWYKYSADAKAAMHSDRSISRAWRCDGMIKRHRKTKSKINKKVVDKPLVR